MGYAEDGAAQEKPTPPLHLYVLQFPLSLVFSIAWSWKTENAKEAWEQLTIPIVGVILFTAANALVLNFVGLYVLKEFGASAQQIIGKLNTICIASLSVAFLGESLSQTVVGGTCFVLGGVAIFEQGTKTGDSYESESEESSDAESLTGDME